MSPLRPDLVDCWIFRVGASNGPGASNGAVGTGEAVETVAVEVLLLRRAPGRILAGLWQCVSGSLEAGERVAAGALREVAEETALDGDAVEAFYDLDLVNQFHEPSLDAVVTAAVFAVRVRADATVTLSREHDSARWLPLAEARREVVWPGYREALERIRDHLLDPARAPWFELDRHGRRRIDALDSGATSSRVGEGPG